MDKLALQYAAQLTTPEEAHAFVITYLASPEQAGLIFPEWTRYKRSLGPYPVVYGQALVEQYQGTRAVAAKAASVAQQLWESEQK